MSISPYTIPIKVFTPLETAIDGFASAIEKAFKLNHRDIQWYQSNPIRSASLSSLDEKKEVTIKAIDECFTYCHFTARTAFSIIVENVVDEDGKKNKKLEERVLQVITSLSTKNLNILSEGVDELEKMVLSLGKNKGLVCHCFIVNDDKSDISDSLSQDIFHEFILDFTPGKDVLMYQSFINHYSLLDKSSRTKFTKNQEILKLLGLYLSQQLPKDDHYLLFNSLFHGSKNDLKKWTSAPKKILFMPIEYEQKKELQKSPKFFIKCLLYAMMFSFYIHFQIGRFSPEFDSQIQKLIKFTI